MEQVYGMFDWLKPSHFEQMVATQPKDGCSASVNNLFVANFIRSTFVCNTYMHGGHVLCKHYGFHAENV